MTALTNFLLARIAEDEASARAQLLARRSDPERFWPKQVAECEAKRQVVETYQGLWALAKSLAQPGEEPTPEVTTVRNMYAGVELTMQLLALPYADHPDYREEWRR